MALRERLPDVRGKYREGAELASTNWFRVGGQAEVLFKPADTQDLADFMKACPKEVPITVLGVGSNLIVRDGGLDGVVIKLGRGFAECSMEQERGQETAPLVAEGVRPIAQASRPEQGQLKIKVGAGCLDVNVATYAAQQGIAGLEFLSGIPGTMGGALMMNAGAYGDEIKDVLVLAELVTREGEVLTLSPEELRYSYRHSEAPEGCVFTGAVLQGHAGEPKEILARIDEIQTARAETQPIRSRTGGSTFKNPAGHKAWELIDAAGCRGMMLGGAQVSEKHCNFLLNTGDASAADLEALGDQVREKVKANSGIELEWEIKRIGKR